MMDIKLAEWFASHDTGLSSEAIALFLSAGVKTGNVPCDSSDFGRCHRLLTRMGWHDHIGKMADAGGRWAALVEIWPALTAAFEADNHEEVYRLIKSVEADGYEREGYTVRRGPRGEFRGAVKGDAQTFQIGKMTMSFGQ